MTYKQIEASRELRLWLTQIGIPMVGGILYLEAHPEIKVSIKMKASMLKNQIKSKFEKES